MLLYAPRVTPPIPFGQRPGGYPHPKLDFGGDKKCRKPSVLNGCMGCLFALGLLVLIALGVWKFAELVLYAVDTLRSFITE
jgi:hypothetical protein